jgi:predicted phosphodiesterase
VKLWALSDLHLNYRINRQALLEIPDHGKDWLLLVGDMGDELNQVREGFEVLQERFSRLVWVPGNHELWTHPKDSAALRGEARYQQWIDLCRSLNILTPEDDYVLWSGAGGPHWIVPLFLLYDYSFCEPGITPEDAVAWAGEHSLRANDEVYLHPDPYPNLPSWCQARLEISQRRLQALSPEFPTILVNHFPLRYDLVRIPRIQRFSVWCGTRATEDWHQRYRAATVVVGHLHVRTTDWQEGTRFEEVALGYPRHWNQEKGAAAYLRQILPAPAPPPKSGFAEVLLHR